MAIYVDDMEANYRNMIMCHMFSDKSLEELHSFAKKIGLKKEWYQTGSAPHYDVSKTRRKLAVRLGAKEIKYGTNKEWMGVYRKAKKLKDY